MTFVKPMIMRGALGLVLGPSVASASDIPVLSLNLCTLHFSRIAYHRPVKNVMAHVGVLKQCGSDGDASAFWTDIHDLNLKTDGDLDHFAEKILLKDKSSTYQGCKTSPIVQFWVTFEDGSVKIEDPVLMKVDSTEWVDSEKGSPEARKVVLDFGRFDLNDVSTVRCANLNSYGDIAYRFVSAVDPSLFPDMF